MANLLSAPGFETATGWTFTTGAGRVSSSDAREGGYVADLLVFRQLLGIDPDTGQPIYGPWTGGMAYADAVVGVGDTVQLGCWVKRISGTCGVRLVAYEPATGSSATIDSLDFDDDADEWTMLAGIHTAASSTVRLRIEAVNDADASGEWHADDCWMVTMAITDTIRDAVVADLGQITTANGYSQTLAAVLTEPRDIQEVPKPGVFILPGPGGNSDTADLGSRTGTATQQFTVALCVQTATPNQDIDNLTDDVRNALERAAGSTMAVSGVVDVVVTDWSEVITDPSVADNLFYREIEVSVAYEYTRGSA